jgi:hypothetical protein
MEKGFNIGNFFSVEINVDFIISMFASRVVRSRFTLVIKKSRVSILLQRSFTCGRRDRKCGTFSVIDLSSLVCNY